MKLLIQEHIATNLTQNLTRTEPAIVEAIRPHIYRHNFPAGTVKVQIHDNLSVLIAESNTVNISAMGTMAYFHGYVKFDINAHLKKNVAYTVSLVSAGYVFNEASYIGWVNGHDLAKYPITGVPASSYNYPLDLEIWERTV